MKLDLTQEELQHLIRALDKEIAYATRMMNILDLPTLRAPYKYDITQCRAIKKKLYLHLLPHPTKE